MALPSAQTLSNSLSALSPSASADTAIPLFVEVIANYTNMVQAGPDGTVGILTFGNAAMISALESMSPVSDSSWVPNFANAWEAGITSGTITAGTVTDSVWSGSGGTDTQTSPSPTSTITTLVTAKGTLISSLETATPDSTAPLVFATAISNATLALSFSCIGLGPPPTLNPITVVFNAQ